MRPTGRLCLVTMLVLSLTGCAVLRAPLNAIPGRGPDAPTAEAEASSDAEASGEEGEDASEGDAETGEEKAEK